MANQQLLDFIKAQTTTGTSSEEIKKALLAAGWPEKYVDEGFGELAHITTPPPPAPPINEFKEQSPNNPNPYAQLYPQSQAATVHYSDTTITPNLVPNKGQRGLWVALTIFGLLIVMGGAVAYGYVMKLGPFSQPPYTADNLLSGLLKTASEINTSAYEFKSTVVVEPRDTDAVPWDTKLVPSPELIQQYRNDYRRFQDVQSILGVLKYQKPYPLLLKTINDSNNSSYKYSYNYSVNLTDPGTKQQYGYTLGTGAQNFLLIVNFETDAAISEIKKSYTYSATTTLISGKQITFTKDSNDYYYLPSSPPKPFLVQLGESMKMMPASASGDLSISASTDWSKQNADWKFNFGAKADLGDMTYNIDFDALRKNEVYYFRVTHFPDIFLMFVESLSNIKGAWIKIDAKASSTQSSYMSYDPLSSLTSELPDAEKSYKENRQNFIDAIAKATKIADSEHLFTLLNPPKSEQVDGRNLYRYDLKVKKESIIAFYKRAIKEIDVKKYSAFSLDEGYITYLESPEFNELFDFYDKNTTLTLWVDGNGFPAIINYKIRVTPPDTVTQLKGKQVNFNLKLTVSDVNKPVNVEEPKDAKTIQEISGQSSIGGSSLAKQARDSTRASDLAALNSTLSLYLSTVEKPILTCTVGKIYKSTSGTRVINGTGWLPVNLNAMSGGSPLSNLPIDPINDSTHYYSYACDTKTLTYELDAKFESDKYLIDLDLSGRDGGDNDNLYEIGTTPSLKLLH